MAKTRGTGLLMVWTDIDAEHEAEFNRWYDEEQILTLYEFEHAGVPDSREWAAARARNPWTRRVHPYLRHDAGSPGVYRWIDPRS